MVDMEKQRVLPPEDLLVDHLMGSRMGFDLMDLIFSWF